MCHTASKKMNKKTCNARLLILQWAWPSYTHLITCRGQGQAPRRRPRMVYSFTAASTMAQRPGGIVMEMKDAGGQDSEGEGSGVQEPGAAAHAPQPAQQSGAGASGAARAVQRLHSLSRSSAPAPLTTVAEMVELDDDSSFASLEGGSAMLPRRRGLQRLPSFRQQQLQPRFSQAGSEATATGGGPSQRRSLARTATM